MEELGRGILLVRKLKIASKQFIGVLINKNNKWKRLIFCLLSEIKAPERL